MAVDFIVFKKEDYKRARSLLRRQVTKKLPHFPKPRLREVKNRHRIRKVDRREENQILAGDAAVSLTECLIQNLKPLQGQIRPSLSTLGGRNSCFHEMTHRSPIHSRQMERTPDLRQFDAHLAVSQFDSGIKSGRWQ